MKTYLLYGLIAVLLLFILLLVFYPLFSGNTFDFYVRFSLLMFAIQTFGILRLYNAVFNNNRFLLKLQVELKKLTDTIVKDDINTRNRANISVQLNQNLRDLKSIIKDSNIINSALNERLRKNGQ